MERAYMPQAEPRPFEHNTSGAPHPKAAVAGPPARTAGFDPIADHRFPQRLRRPCPEADLAWAPGIVWKRPFEAARGVVNLRRRTYREAGPRKSKSTGLANAPSSLGPASSFVVAVDRYHHDHQVGTELLDAMAEAASILAVIAR